MVDVRKRFEKFVNTKRNKLNEQIMVEIMKYNFNHTKNISSEFISKKTKVPNEIVKKIISGNMDVSFEYVESVINVIKQNNLTEVNTQNLDVKT